jgi:predicted enzyme related to lactoylglutathione lyase
VASKLTQVAIDSADPRRLAEFWAAVLGYDITESDTAITSLEPPDRSGPGIDFVQVPEPKKVKNRLHLDLSPSDRDQAEEVERIVNLGARRIDIGQGEASWVVLADPEGNEFCVLRTRRP